MWKCGPWVSGLVSLSALPLFVKAGSLWTPPAPTCSIFCSLNECIRTESWGWWSRWPHLNNSYRLVSLLCSSCAALRDQARVVLVVDFCTCLAWEIKTRLLLTAGLSWEKSSLNIYVSFFHKPCYGGQLLGDIFHVCLQLGRAQALWHTAWKTFQKRPT